MIVVTEAAVREAVRFEDAISAVAEAFRAFDLGESVAFPVVRGSGSDPSHFFAVKSGRDGSSRHIGLKAGSFCPANKAFGIAAHTSTIMLIDDVSGAVRALVSANHLNGMRTAAADALAASYLARKDARVIGVIGAGHQAAYDVEALTGVRSVDRVIAVRRSPDGFARFADHVLMRTGLSVEVATEEQVVRQADILITATPSVAALVRREWVRPGTHISAMGADGMGKQELDIDLVASADVYVDVPEQAISIGECQHAWRAGLISAHRIENFTLGGLVSGRVAGRMNDDAITLFDSSGAAFQDLAVAFLATTQAVKKKLAIEIDLFENASGGIPLGTYQGKS